jgi:prepilin-type N-terminal cleavage/methylation domain-containing protein
MTKRTKQGFTLIELMIVVAIIGILAAIAIPKFADLINKSKEGATKGALSSVRSALQVYYGDNEGWFPTDDLAILIENAKYINEIPVAKVPTTGHADTKAVALFSSATVAGVFSGGTGTADAGGWAYFNDPTVSSMWGTFTANCTHEDIKGQGVPAVTPWSAF